MPCLTCPRPAAAITRREQAVLTLLAQGRQTGAIASTLCLSVKTVETYYRHLRRKLAVANLNELIVYAVWQAIYGR